MKKEPLIHLAVLLLALGLSGKMVMQQQESTAWEPLATNSPATPPPTVEDATDNSVATADYRRIVVCTGAGLVQQLVPLDRIVAVDAATSNDPATGWKFTGCLPLPDPTDVDAILRCNPDLVIARELSSSGAKCLRDSGCAVFDPGEVTSLADHQTVTGKLGMLLHAANRAETVNKITGRRARVLSLHPRPQTVAVFQNTIPPGDAARLRPLEAACELAGLVLTDDRSKGRLLDLEAGTFSDPLGSDLVEMATELRTRLPNPLPSE